MKFFIDTAFRHQFAATSQAGCVNAALSYSLLQQTVIPADGPSSLLKQAIGNDGKGKVSPLLYIAAMVVAFWIHWVAQAIYVAVALIWLVPDRRIERVVNGQSS
jgi:uncharacterized membrane protein